MSRPRCRGVLYTLCGLAFSGKTWLAGALSERLGAIVVSLDEINARRGLHGGAGVRSEEWARSHRVALDEIGQAMELGAARVVVDDTSCFRFLRDSYRDLARKHSYSMTLVVVEPPLELIYRRMRENELVQTRAPIRRTVFEELLSSFEWPDADERPVRLTSESAAQEWVEVQAAEMR